MSAFGAKADVDQPLLYQSRFMSTRPRLARGSPCEPDLGSRLVETLNLSVSVQRTLGLVSNMTPGFDLITSRMVRAVASRLLPRSRACRSSFASIRSTRAGWLRTVKLAITAPLIGVCMSRSAGVVIKLHTFWRDPRTPGDWVAQRPQRVHQGRRAEAECMRRT
jgi:hypothetical protein